ncbi:MAG: tetratricopeptide repeat protein [Myxococcaceae bacterium]
MSAVFLLLLAAADPCTAPIAPLGGDAREAAIYVRVGDAERDRGNLGAAREAYRAALARAPGSVEAMARLQAVCAPAPDPLQAGVDALESGHPAAALPLFAAARGRGNDRAIDLLEGISRYQLGEDARAVPLLESARADPALAESASFFLGLVALRRGDGDRATRLFAQARHAMGLEDTARQLSRMAQLEGHVVLSAATEVVYDTNVALRPDGAPTTLPGPDGSVGITLMALVRPWGTPGPYARVEGQLSKQFTLTQLDLVGGAGALGFKLLGPTASLTGEYAYGVQAVDGRAYLADQRIFLGGSLLTGNFLWGAAYAAHFESYRWSGLSDLSGLRQVLELDAGFLPGGGVRLTAGWAGTWDAARIDPLSYLEHGPILELLWARGPVTLGARGSIAWRTYQAEDPAYGAIRDDTRYAGTTWLDVALGIQWAVRGAVRFLRVDSNIPDLNATEWVFSTSLVWTAAVL